MQQLASSTRYTGNEKSSYTEGVVVFRVRCSEMDGVFSLYFRYGGCVEASHRDTPRMTSNVQSKDEVNEKVRSE